MIINLRKKRTYKAIKYENFKEILKFVEDFSQKPVMSFDVVINKDDSITLFNKMILFPDDYLVYNSDLDSFTVYPNIGEILNSYDLIEE